MVDDDAEATEADAAAASAAASRAALAALRPVEGFTLPCASIPCVQTKTFPYPRQSCPVTAHLWQVGHERSQRSRRRRQLWHDLLVLGMRQTVPPLARSFLFFGRPAPARTVVYAAAGVIVVDVRLYGLR
jgi:hypothetical protein